MPKLVNFVLNVYINVLTSYIIVLIFLGIRVLRVDLTQSPLTQRQITLRLSAQRNSCTYGNLTQRVFISLSSFTKPITYICICVCAHARVSIYIYIYIYIYKARKWWLKKYIITTFKYIHALMTQHRVLSDRVVIFLLGCYISSFISQNFN